MAITLIVLLLAAALGFIGVVRSSGKSEVAWSCLLLAVYLMFQRGVLPLG